MDLQYEHVYFYLRRGTSMQIYMSFRHSQRRSRDGGGHFVKYTNIHTIPKPYQNKMSNLDSFSSLVHFSLLHVYLYYRLDTCITGPLPSFSHFFGWEANLFLVPQKEQLKFKMASNFCKGKNKGLFSIMRVLQCVAAVILLLLLVIITFNHITNKETVMSIMEKIKHSTR